MAKRYREQSLSDQEDNQPLQKIRIKYSKTKEITVKPTDNHGKKCRVCCGEGHIPIFGNSSCKDLSSMFSSVTNLSITLDDPLPKFLCTYCESLLQGAILFKNSAERSASILVDQLNCKREESISDHADLDVQDNTKDSDMKYHCVVCDVYFTSLTEIHKHRRTPEHHNAKYKCPVCSKECTLKNYKLHLKSHHDEFICDICGKTFPLKQTLFRHKFTHGYELPYQCQQCPYRGRFPESLKLHMRSHTGEKPYQCPHCPVRCSRKGNLNRHVLTHKKVFDHHCDTCGKGFYSKRELDAHFKVEHLGIKDFPCSMCGKAFGSRKQMSKHQLKVHKRAKKKSGRTPLYVLAAQSNAESENIQ